MMGTIKGYYYSLLWGTVSLPRKLRHSLFCSPPWTLFAGCPALNSTCCTVLKEAGPKKYDGARCKHQKSARCFGWFLCPLLPALPLHLPGCRKGFNPTGDRFFLSVGTHIGHADASSLHSDGSGRAKNGASFFPLKKNQEEEWYYWERGASLRCYSWDRPVDHPLFHGRSRCCQTHGCLCWTLSCVLDTTFTVAKRIRSCDSHIFKPQRSWKKSHSRSKDSEKTTLVWNDEHMKQKRARLLESHIDYFSNSPYLF